MTPHANPIDKTLFRFFSLERVKGPGGLLLVITLHLSAWILFFILPILFLPIHINDHRLIYREALGKLMPVGLFYLNYYYLLPRIFEKRRFLTYFLSISLCLLLILFSDVMIRKQAPQPSFLFFRGPGESGMGIIRRDSMSTPPGQAFFTMPSKESFHMANPPDMNRQAILGIPKGLLFMSVNRTLSLCIFLLLMSGLIRLSFVFLKNQHEKRWLENVNLNAEVNLLKAQINPHFLFNTLNGIYALAHSRSPDTETAVLKLSELMRYVMYDASHEKVDLSTDIGYLNNYVDLQRLRLSSKVTIHYEVEGETAGLRIAPLLLITFIENAFKHGISYSNPSVIRIKIRIFEKTLTLLAENPVTESNSFTSGGLGLKNVTRRLELLYPGRHELNIVHNDRLHIVHLKLIMERD